MTTKRTEAQQQTRDAAVDAEIRAVKDSIAANTARITDSSASNTAHITAIADANAERITEIANANKVAIQAVKESLTANTKITEQTREDVAQLRANTAPVVDALHTMEAGIRTIGNIGSAGLKVGKFTLVTIACWGALKLLLHGASWADVTDYFNRIVGR